MFCPEGHGELREGFTVCPDCGAALVADDPRGEKNHPDPHLVTVFTTADSSLLPILESLLDDAGIPYRMRGEGTLSLFPSTGVGLAIDPKAAGVEVQVPADRAEEARALLEPQTGLVPPEADADSEV